MYQKYGREPTTASKMKGGGTTSSSYSPAHRGPTTKMAFHSTSRVAGFHESKSTFPKQTKPSKDYKERIAAPLPSVAEKHKQFDTIKTIIQPKRRELFPEDDEESVRKQRQQIAPQPKLVVGLKDIVTSKKKPLEKVYRKEPPRTEKKKRESKRNRSTSSSSFSPRQRLKVKTSPTRVANTVKKTVDSTDHRGGKKPILPPSMNDSPVIARKTVRTSDPRVAVQTPQLMLTVSEDTESSEPIPKIFKSVAKSQLVEPYLQAAPVQQPSGALPSSVKQIVLKSALKPPPQLQSPVSKKQKSGSDKSSSPGLEQFETPSLPEDIEETKREILREKMLGKRLVVDIDEEEVDCVPDGIIGSTAPSQNHTATNGSPLEDPLRLNISPVNRSSSTIDHKSPVVTHASSTKTKQQLVVEQPSTQEPQAQVSGDQDSVMITHKESFGGLSEKPADFQRSRALLSKIIEENRHEDKETHPSRNLGTSFGSIQREVEESLQKLIARAIVIEEAREPQHSIGKKSKITPETQETVHLGKKSVARSGASGSRGKTALIAALEDTDSVMEASPLPFDGSQLIIPKDPQLEKVKGLLLMDTDSEDSSQRFARHMQQESPSQEEEEATPTDSEDGERQPQPTNKMIGAEILSHFIKGDVVGEGGNSVVNLIIRKETGKEYALKTCKEKTDPRGIQKEFEILRRLRHRYVIQAYMAHPDEDESFLILEFFRGQNLHQYIRALADKKVSEQHGKEIVRKIVEALHYLHENKLGHRDIKLENVLINEEGDIRLIDFAYSDFFEPNTLIKGYCGTPSYMSPEIYRKERYCPKKADVWALGVLIHKLVLGGPPFQGNKKNGLLATNILKCKFRADKIKGISEELRDLLARTIHPIPAKRPTTRELLDHAWLRQEPIMLTDDDVEESSSEP